MDTLLTRPDVVFDDAQFLEAIKAHRLERESSAPISWTSELRPPATAGRTSSLRLQAPGIATLRANGAMCRVPAMTGCITPAPAPRAAPGATGGLQAFACTALAAVLVAAITCVVGFIAATSSYVMV